MFTEDLIWARHWLVLQVENEGHRLKARAGDSRKGRRGDQGSCTGMRAEGLHLGLQRHVHAVFGALPEAMRQEPNTAYLAA